MIAKRLGAAVLAIALIAGALVLRRNVIEGADDETATPGTDEPAVASGDLICITELAAVCATIREQQPELAVTVEDALVTVDKLAALDDGAAVPLWLTVAPFPAMVDGIRASTAGLEPLALGGDVLAVTPLVIAAPVGGRFARLATACPDTPTWRCLGELAGTPWVDLDGEPTWATVRPSVGQADRSAVALASFAAAVAGYFDSPTYSRSTWDLDADFIGWVRRLVRAVPPDRLSGGTPLAAMATRASALDMAATTGVELAALDPAGERFEGNDPRPAMWLEAVLAAPAEVDRTAADVATTALTAAGWSAPAEVTGTLPSATTMLALRTLWQEAT